MQSHYEINVSQNGRHLFATHERSALTKQTAWMLFELISSKFPVEKGYQVTCTYWEASGSEVTFK